MESIIGELDRSNLCSPPWHLVGSLMIGGQTVGGSLWACRLGVRGIASLEAAVGKGWSGEEIEGEECEDDDVVGACGSHCGHGVDGARRLGFDVPGDRR